MTVQHELTIVVVIHNMAREAPRTLLSLAPDHQHVDADRYEIIVVDNGSADPLPHDRIALAGPNVRYHRIEPAAASPSPAAAVNVGACLARGRLLGVVVDGARMASPGLVAAVLAASTLGDDVVITTLAWHLGPDAHARSVPAGYDQDTEDGLLAGIGWPSDGHRLFEIATIAPASAKGHLFALPECSAVFASLDAHREIAGFDERFDQPAGGLAASDYLQRLVDRPGALPVVLAGEATFHQLHSPQDTYEGRTVLLDQYEELRGRPFTPVPYRPILYGRPRPQEAQVLARSAVMLSRSGAADESP